MCGIVGIISKKPAGFFSTDADMLENMLLLDYIRGKHSTGVFGVHNSNQVSVAKIASHPLDLFACTDWGGFRSKMSKSMHMVIGHNRRATGGRISSENAHPFVENNIVLVHNGVIHSGVETKNKEIDVDSHMVCEAFAKSNYEEVVKSIHGAFTFVWYDTKTKLLHTLRNDERPMNIIETDDHYYLASEPWMVQGLLSRDNLERTKVRSVTSTEVGQLYSFERNKPYTKVAVELAKERTYETYSVGRPVNQSWHQRGNHLVPFNPRSQTETPRLLTSNGESATTGGGSDGVLTFPRNQGREDFYKRLHVESGGLVAPGVNQEVLFKIFSLTSVATRVGFHRVIGQVCSSGHAKTDISFMTDDAGVYLENTDEIFQGKIKNVAWLANGPVIEIEKPTVVQYINLHDSRVPLLEWRELLRFGKCHTCSRSLLSSKQDVTKVRWNKDKKVWDCTCHFCIAGRIAKGPIRDAFMKKAGLVYADRADAVQDAVIVSEVIGNPSTSPPGPASTATSQLH